MISYKTSIILTVLFDIIIYCNGNAEEDGFRDTLSKVGFRDDTGFYNVFLVLQFETAELFMETYKTRMFTEDNNFVLTEKEKEYLNYSYSIISKQRSIVQIEDLFLTPKKFCDTFIEEISEMVDLEKIYDIIPEKVQNQIEDDYEEITDIHKRIIEEKIVDIKVKITEIEDKERIEEIKNKLNELTDVKIESTTEERKKEINDNLRNIKNKIKEIETRVNVITEDHHLEIEDDYDEITEIEIEIVELKEIQKIIKEIKIESEYDEEIKNKKKKLEDNCLKSILHYKNENYNGKVFKFDEINVYKNYITAFDMGTLINPEEEIPKLFKQLSDYYKTIEIQGFPLRYYLYWVNIILNLFNGFPHLKVSKLNEDYLKNSNMLIDNVTQT